MRQKNLSRLVLFAKESVSRKLEKVTLPFCKLNGLGELLKNYSLQQHKVHRGSHLQRKKKKTHKGGLLFMNYGKL